ncbi:hypothetical protein ACKWTF_016307 [Chironomus riparius]
MGDVQVDFIKNDETCFIILLYVNTMNSKITSFKSIDDLNDPEIYRKVTRVFIYPSYLPTFPSELSDFFPNLEYIEIYNAEMKTICSNDLKGFTKLKKLRLDFNKISYLPGNLFEFTPKISQISFANNKITKIGPQIFDKLENLIKFDLRGNPNISYKYNKGFQDLNALKFLIQEQCKLIISLKDMAKEVLKLNMNDEVRAITHHLGIFDMDDNRKTKFVKCYY